MSIILDINSSDLLFSDLQRYTLKLLFSLIKRNHNKKDQFLGNKTSSSHSSSSLIKRFIHIFSIGITPPVPLNFVARFLKNVTWIYNVWTAEPRGQLYLLFLVDIHTISYTQSRMFERSDIILFITVLYCIRNLTVLCTVLYNCVLKYKVVYCNIQLCTVLYSCVLYYTIVYCTI